MGATLDFSSIWDCYRLRISTSFTQITVRSNEPTFLQVLSWTPIVKNGFPVRLPLVRILFPPPLTSFPENHYHFLALDSHITPAFGVPC